MLFYSKMRLGLVTTHIKASCYFVPANWGMVTALEVFYFAIRALCIGDFSNCEHGKTRAEDLQVPLEEFHSYRPFLSLNPSSSVRDEPHCFSRSSASRPWESQGGAGGAAGLALSRCSCACRNPQRRNAPNAEGNPSAQILQHIACPSHGTIASKRGMKLVC